MSHESRSSVTRALRRIVNATEDFVDEVLDRAGDVEHDLRHSLSRALDDEDSPSRRRRSADRDAAGADAPKAESRRTEPRKAETRKASVPRTRDPDELSALREQVETLTRRLEQLSDAQK